jgi:hypothetical protein
MVAKKSAGHAGIQIPVIHPDSSLFAVSIIILAGAIARHKEGEGRVIKRNASQSGVDLQLEVPTGFKVLGDNSRIIVQGNVS